MVIAMKVQDPSELQQLAGRANRSRLHGEVLPVPVVVNFDEATLRQVTFSRSLRDSLKTIKSAPSTCIAKQLQSQMIPPTCVRSGGDCGTCAGCDRSYREQVESWLGTTDNELDPQAFQPPERNFLLEAIAEVDLDELVEL